MSIDAPPPELSRAMTAPTSLTPSRRPIISTDLQSKSKLDLPTSPFLRREASVEQSVPWRKSPTASAHPVACKCGCPNGANLFLPPATQPAMTTKPKPSPVKSPPATNPASRALARRRWRKPMLALRVGRLTPLPLDPASLDLPLPTCPATSTAVLSNGLTYFIRSNPKESEEQLGLAHFLEHACFLKLKSYDKGELIKFLESAGLDFGADLNAHTSFSETVYKLHVPLDDPDQSILKESIKIMGEWAHELVVDDSMIETERNVVGEEHRAGLGLDDRIYRKWIKCIFGHEKIASRNPIGGDGSIVGQLCVQQASPEQLRKYYKTHYRPELAAIIAVGDFAPIGGHAPILEMIEEHLGEGAWPRTPPALFSLPPKVSLTAPKAPPPLPAGPRILIQRESELQWARVDLGIILPHQPNATTSRTFKAQLIQDLWYSILSNRLEKIVEGGGEDPPFVQASAGYNMFEGTRMAEFSAVAKDEMGESRETALNKLLVEVLRQCRFGVLGHELERVRSEYTTNTRWYWAERHDIESVAFAQDLCTHFVNDSDSTSRCSDEYSYRLTLKLLEIVQLQELQEFSEQMRTMIEVVGFTWCEVQVPVRGKEDEGACGGEEEVFATIKHAIEQADIQPPDDTPPRTLDLVFKRVQEAASSSPPLTITHKRTIPLPTLKPDSDRPIELKVQHWSLSNGATVTFCRTPFEADSINWTATALGGTREMKKASLTYLSAVGWSQLGVGNLTNSELNAACAGIDAAGWCHWGKQSRSIGGYCSPGNVRECFDLMWADVKAARLDLQELRRQLILKREGLRFEKRNNEPSFWFKRAQNKFQFETGGWDSDDRTAAKKLWDFGVAKCLHICLCVAGESLALRYGLWRQRRRVAKFEKAGVLESGAKSFDNVLGGTSASQFHWTAVGALPPDAELEAVLLSRLGAFDEKSEVRVVGEDGDANVIVGDKKGEVLALRDTESKRLCPGAKSWWLSGEWHIDVRRNAEEQSETEMIFRSGVIDVEAVGREEAKNVTKRRAVACKVATALLLRRLRQDLGLVYSIWCGYGGRSDDPYVAVSFTSKPTDAVLCRAEVRQVFEGLCEEGGVTVEDHKAVLEQNARDKEEELFFNSRYEGIIENSLDRVRKRDGGGRKRVLMRAADVDAASLEEEVKWRIRVEGGGDGSLSSVQRECGDLFAGKRGCLSCTLLPERRGAAELRELCLWRAGLVSLALAVAGELINCS